MAQKTDGFAALRYPEFRAFAGAQFFFTVAILMQEVSVGYEIYRLTKDPLSLGWIGLSEAIPYILIALYGGYLADKYDRKRIIAWCFLLFLISSSLLIFVFSSQTASLETQQKILLVYSGTFLIGIARGFFSPTWSSLKPYLVAEKHYSNLASWSAQCWQSGMILGPIIGAFTYAYLGIFYTLCIAWFVLVLSYIFTRFIAPKPIARKSNESIFKSLKEGIKFVYSQKIIFYAILLDMFSVLFGGVMAILPVFAEDILKIGPTGYGYLRAAPGLGAVLTMFATAFYPPTRRAWPNMMFAILGFGVCTLVFAFSKSYMLSLAMLFLTGAFDSISVIIRQTIMQLLPPPELRGRVSSVNGIFVSCSNELGAFESGLAAKLLGTVPSVVFGGIMTLTIGGLIFYKSRALLNYKLIKDS